MQIALLHHKKDALHHAGLTLSCQLFHNKRRKMLISRHLVKTLRNFR